MQTQDQEDTESGGLTMVVPVHFRGSSAPNRLKGSGDPNSGSGPGQSSQDQDKQQEETMEMPDCEEWMRPKRRNVKKGKKGCDCCPVRMQKVQQEKSNIGQFLSENKWARLEEEYESEVQE